MDATISVKTESGRMFEVDALFMRDVFAVNANYMFFFDDELPDRALLPGYYVTHVPTGESLAHFTNKRHAAGFCRWMAKNFPGYDPNEPEHEAARKALMKDIHAVVHSYGGFVLSSFPDARQFA